MSYFTEYNQRERALRLKEVLSYNVWFEYDDKHYNEPFTREQMTNTNWVLTLGYLFRDMVNKNDFFNTGRNIHHKLIAYIQSDAFDIEDYKQNKQLGKALNRLLYKDYSFMYANYDNARYEPSLSAFYYVIKKFPHVLTKDYFYIVMACVCVASYKHKFSELVAETIETFDLNQQKEIIGLLSSCETLFDVDWIFMHSQKLKSVYDSMKATVEQDYTDLISELIHDFDDVDPNEVNTIYKQFLSVY